MEITFDISEPLVLELNSIAENEGFATMEMMTRSYWRYKIEAIRQGALEDQLRIQLAQSIVDLDDLYTEE